MRYKIKAYLLNNGILDCRFEILLHGFDDTITFLSKVSLEAYDVVKVFPEDFEV